MLEEIFQGFCMAMADSVPGVSGGSIAFLMGFYNEFITSLIFYRGRGRKSRCVLWLRGRWSWQSRRVKHSRIC